MTDFIQGESRNQATLFPERLDDYIAEENAVRFIDAFVDELPKARLGFRTEPSDLGRPAYDPSMMLKLYIYGDMNQVQSSRRLERVSAQRGADVADGEAGTGLQDDSGLS
jgi:transposase